MRTKFLATYLFILICSSDDEVEDTCLFDSKKTRQRSTDLFTIETQKVSLKF